MFGAIIGDIIGSTYEWHNVKTEDFELFPQGSRFTDDTVLSVAVAEKILNSHLSVVNSRKSYALWYKQYYRRYPNAGFGQMFAQWVESDFLRIQRSYGNGAAMRVTAIGLAYEDMDEMMAEVKESYVFDSRTSYSVPPAIEAFLEAQNYEDAIRKAISIGGDSDTIACIAGGIAQAYYGEIPEKIKRRAMSILDSGLKKVVGEFESKYLK